MFSGVWWNQPVCPFVRVSFVQDNSLSQSSGGGIKSHLVAALVPLADQAFHSKLSTQSRLLTILK